MRRFPPIKTSILERNPQPATLRSSRVTDSNQLLRDHAPVPASTCDGTRLGWCHKDLAPSWYIWRNFSFFLRNFRDTLPSDNHNMAGTSTIDGFLSYEPPLVRDVPLLCLIPGGYVTRCNWHMGITLQKKNKTDISPAVSGYTKRPRRAGWHLHPPPMWNIGHLFGHCCKDFHGIQSIWGSKNLYKRLRLHPWHCLLIIVDLKGPVTKQPCMISFLRSIMVSICTVLGF